MTMITPPGAAGDAGPLVGEVSRAMTGLVLELKGFRSDIETKLQ